MSRVGDIEKMYGTTFNIVTTNASGTDIINTKDASLIPSSLIISSPLDANGNDLGVPTVLVTDDEGSPVRLTYVIKPGNGLVLGYTYTSDHADVLSLAIDNDTLQTFNGGSVHDTYLYVSSRGLTEYSQYLNVSGINNLDLDIDELPDDNRIKVAKQTITNSVGESADVKRLTIDASKIIDNVTLNVKGDINNCFSYQLVYVKTNQIVDNYTIVTSFTGTNDNRREIATVKTENLAIASPSKPGIVKYDNSSIKMNKLSQLYVDTTKLTQISSKGGVGIIKLEAAGKSDLYVDTTGFVRTDPKYMPKCGIVDKAKNSGGWGVCAVDGKTITATHDGVIKVRSAGLDVATTSDLGVVRPDNTSIVIEKSGVIKVKPSGLPVGSASNVGLVKYDNVSITKNTQGQLTVTKATQWDTAISDLNTRMSTLQEQLAAIRTELSNTLTNIVAKAEVPFNIYTKQGKSLESMMIHIPNVTTYKNGTHAWDTADANGTFTINYGTGYIFTCRLNGGSNSSWMQSCSIIIDGQRYGMNQDIKLQTNNVTCSIELTISGYGTSKIERPQGSWSLEFKDNNGNPLKSINLYVHSCYSLTKVSQFTCTLNGKSYASITTNTNINVSSTKISQMITKSPIMIGGTKLINRNLTVGGITLMSASKL